MKAHPQEYDNYLEEIKAEAKYLKAIKNNVKNKPRDQRGTVYQQLLDLSQLEEGEDFKKEMVSF